MTYKFTLLSDEVDDFFRIIEIDSDATFFDFHEAILDSVGFTKDNVTSFFLCSDNWEREQEITLMEMETDSEYDNLVMADTVLSDFLEDEKQKLVYVFDMIFERLFFIELTEIITRKTLLTPICLSKRGEVNQTVDENEAPKIASVEIFDEVFGEENILDINDLDDESYSDINIDSDYEH